VTGVDSTEKAFTSPDECFEAAVKLAVADVAKGAAELAADLAGLRRQVEDLAAMARPDFTSPVWLLPVAVMAGPAGPELN
jgi:hypothetical protein